MAEITDAEVFDRSIAVAELQVVSAESFYTVNKTIRTRLTLSPVEIFKGKLPRKVQMTVAGGTLDGRTDFGSDSLPLEVGKSYVLMMSNDKAGNWSAESMYAFEASEKPKEVVKFFRNRARGKRPDQASSSKEISLRGTDEGFFGIQGSRITATGYSVTTQGHPTRFTTADAGESIPYVIDIDPKQLPSGMTQAGAIAAVAEAVNAWAKSSSLRFHFEGIESFGMAARDVAIDDGRLRIQLHDNFDAVQSVGVLGIGGGRFFESNEDFTAGVIGSQGFQKRTRGYVVIESVSNNPLLKSVSIFKRVLTHEIGHSLGLTHSSEDLEETDLDLKNATMYFVAQPDSAGATIQAYDADRIQFGYSQTSSPPVVTDRIMNAVTASSLGSLPQDVIGLNRIQLRAFSRQGVPLTAILKSSTTLNGSFSLSGNILIYTPASFVQAARYSDSAIESGIFRDSASIQFSDGVNLSPIVKCRVVSLQADTTPSDGLPDDWMIANFESKATGALNSGRHPDDDPDKDGLTNRLEFYLNTNPNSAASGPVTPTYDHATRQLSFTPVRFAPYWVESSTTLGSDSWTVRKAATSYQSSGKISSDFSGTTAPVSEFYRVVVAP